MGKGQWPPITVSINVLPSLKKKNCTIYMYFISIKEKFKVLDQNPSLDDNIHLGRK
jgi:hypothetical protein